LIRHTSVNLVLALYRQYYQHFMYSDANKYNIIARDKFSLRELMLNEIICESSIGPLL